MTCFLFAHETTKMTCWLTTTLFGFLSPPIPTSTFCFSHSTFEIFQQHVYQIDRLQSGYCAALLTPMIEDCASNLSTWAPPLPDWCRKPGILIEIFDLLARRIGINYSIVMLDKDHAGSVNSEGNFDGQVNKELLFESWFRSAQFNEVTSTSASTW